jgi:hypothetical protein
MTGHLPVVQKPSALTMGMSGHFGKALGERFARERTQSGEGALGLDARRTAVRLMSAFPRGGREGAARQSRAGLRNGCLD